MPSQQFEKKHMVCKSQYSFPSLYQRNNGKVFHYTIFWVSKNFVSHIYHTTCRKILFHKRKILERKFKSPIWGLLKLHFFKTCRTQIVYTIQLAPCWPLPSLNAILYVLRWQQVSRQILASTSVWLKHLLVDLKNGVILGPDLIQWQVFWGDVSGEFSFSQKLVEWSDPILLPAFLPCYLWAGVNCWKMMIKSDA